MSWDFKRFPELPDSQLDAYYWQSPHKQIFHSIVTTVEEVHDGDTIKVRWAERDFPFKVRLAKAAAPEVGGKKGKETGGDEAQSWLENLVLGKEVTLEIDPSNRVDKFGRLLAGVTLAGVDVVQEGITIGVLKDFDSRNEGKIPELNTIFKPLQEVSAWL